MRPYIDTHVHIGETISRSPAVGQSAGRYMGRMADSGVVAAILSPTAGSPQARGVLDTREQNQAVATACRLYPKRFPIGLGIVEVRHGRDGVRELERSMDEDGLLGFMVHPGLSGHSLGGEMHPFMEVVAERSGLCLLHQAGSTRNIAALARRFPQATIIIGHVSMNAAAQRDAIQHCAELPNVWYDIAQMPADAAADWDLPQLMAGLNAAHVLFGGDTPYYDYRLVQGLVEAAAITDAQKDAIASGNATTLIRKFRPDWALPAEPVVPPQKYSPEQLWATKEPGSPRLL